MGIKVSTIMRNKIFILISIFCLLASASYFNLPWNETVNDAILDLQFKVRGDRSISDDIAIVFIGDIISKKIIDEFLSFFSLSQDDEVLEGDEITLKKFGITENEIKTVKKAKYGDLILEKVAFVDIIK